MTLILAGMAVYLFFAIITLWALWGSRKAMSRLKMVFVIIAAPICDVAVLVFALPFIYFCKIQAWAQDYLENEQQPTQSALRLVK